MPAARLIPTTTPDHPSGLVLVLHGGGSRGPGVAVSPTQSSVLRMIPVAWRLARAGRGRLVVARLLNSVRGWDTAHTPVDDATWAVAELRRRHGDALPIALVGHSLGGRAALLGLGLPGVRSAVALAPWVQPTDSVACPPDRRVLIVHGTRDRVASLPKAMELAGRLRRSAPVGVVRVSGGTHAMLRHHRSFDGAAAAFVAATLLGDPVDGPVGRILAGAELVDTD